MSSQASIDGVFLFTGEGEILEEKMIENVDILRIEQGEEGTFGVLRINGRAWCVTLEPPDAGNVRDISCIPVGRYRCRRVESRRFGDTFEITDVPGRSHILLHPGNVVSDTRGCVLLARQFGSLRGDRAVLNSGRTFASFMEYMADVEEFPLVVTEAPGEVA